MQQAAPGILRSDSWNMMVPPSHPATGQHTFASEPSFATSFPADLQTVKSGDRVTSAAYGMASMPTQQSGTLMGHSAPGLSPSKAEAPTNGLALRQESLEAIASTELTRSKGLGGSQTLFADVLEQLSSKEESLPMQAALYSLPSMQFLESLLDEMDSRSTDAGCQPPEPPLYLPIDSFDLPGLDGPSATVSDISHLGLPPLPRRVHSANAAVGATHQSAPRPIIPRMAPPQPSYGGYVPMAPTAGSAAASPQKGAPMIRRPGPAAVARQTAAALEELYGFEDAEVSLQMSKSGRVRKVTSFTGVKRKVGDMVTQVSAPAALAGEPISTMHQYDSQMTTTSCDVDCEDEMSRDSRRVPGKKSKRTVCLNCGSHQTPQWRCGPLGPRTLCNACGVRYKKGLPLNCWPLREGMVLPPGAVLPSTVQVPPGLNIITQPMDSE